MILNIENPKEATRKVREVISGFGDVAGYKINAQKSLAFLYTNDETSESESKKTLLFTIKQRKYCSCGDTTRTKDSMDKGPGIQ